ncbi:cyanate transporter [Zobellella aerophila]|uniref:CynX/NimT family MFS transporter n=1 Tax=Zobellella aerophila TaxID=870480 RepID=A0ABP6W100_9GAMM
MKMHEDGQWKDEPRIGFLLLLLIGLNLRPFLTSLGPVLDKVRLDTGVNYGTAAFITSLPFLLMGGLAFASVILIRHCGERSALMAALTLLGVGCGARLWIEGGGSLVLSAGLAGSGVAVIQALLPGVAKRWFPHRINLAMGLYSAALVGGGALGAIVSPWVSEQLDSWRWGLALWSLPAFMVLLLWYWLAPSPPTPVSNDACSPGLTPFLLNRRAWLLALYFGLANSGYSSLVAWLPSFYREYGFGSQSTGNLLAWMALFQAAAALLMPCLARKSKDRRPVLYLALLLQLAGFIGFALLPGSYPWLWVALAGSGLGGFFSLSLILSLDHLHQAQAAGTLAAFVQGVGFIIAATAPWLLGAWLDLGGNFVSGWWVHGGVACSMLFLSRIFDPDGYRHAMGNLQPRLRTAAHPERL